MGLILLMHTGVAAYSTVSLLTFSQSNKAFSGERKEWSPTENMGVTRNPGMSMGMNGC